MLFAWVGVSLASPKKGRERKRGLGMQQAELGVYLCRTGGPGKAVEMPCQRKGEWTQAGGPLGLPCPSGRLRVKGVGPVTEAAMSHL